MSLRDIYDKWTGKEKNANRQKVDHISNKFGTGFTPQRNPGDPTKFNLDEVDSRSNPNSPKYSDSPKR